MAAQLCEQVQGGDGKKGKEVVAFCKSKKHHPYAKDTSRSANDIMFLTGGYNPLHAR